MISPKREEGKIYGLLGLEGFVMLKAVMMLGCQRYICSANMNIVADY